MIRPMILLLLCSAGITIKLTALIAPPIIGYLNKHGACSVVNDLSDMDERKRKQNERKYPQWNNLECGGRRYWYEIQGRTGWKARYVKEVDKREITLRFHQEIYDNEGMLMEIHRKYPVDYGHQPVKEER